MQSWWLYILGESRHHLHTPKLSWSCLASEIRWDWACSGWYERLRYANNMGGNTVWQERMGGVRQEIHVSIELCNVKKEKITIQKNLSGNAAEWDYWGIRLRNWNCPPSMKTGITSWRINLVNKKAWSINFFFILTFSFCLGLTLWLYVWFLRSLYSWNLCKRALKKMTSFRAIGFHYPERM